MKTQQEKKMNTPYFSYIVNGEINRYMFPALAKRKDWKLSAGDKIKFYGFAEHEKFTEMLGKKMIVIRFKKNTSRIFKHWIVEQDVFYGNITLQKNKWYKKLLVETK